MSDVGAIGASSAVVAGRRAASTRAPFRIGNVAMDSPFVLAPLAGVSDSPFRRLAREQGARPVYTEMVSVGRPRARQPGDVRLLRVRPERAADRHPAVRLRPGHHGRGDARARPSCREAQRPDLIDINMGCPVRKVVNRCAGAALLQDVPRIAAHRRAHGWQSRRCR